METVWREEDGERLAATVWRAGPGHRMISSAMLGGGIGPAGWVLNAQVPGAYSRTDPVAHLAELAALYRLEGPGVGMLTAASVARTMRRDDAGVHVSATVGLRVPTWAASPDGVPDPELAPLDGTSRSARTPGTANPGTVTPGTVNPGTATPGTVNPGTVNIVVAVPVRLSDAALVNAVVTATEAKTQALLEAGYPCTGTASDAVCVAAASGGAEHEVFAGPRSTWGSRIARAVHAAVHAGAVDYTRYLETRG
ncbi:adenosylcobinamide amidohydrolase [Actinomadura meyerae]|uniref:adenosylcobinamide amidohydrolase n=1 Tax=Actinomadura meyerae TaxID=240840 RepID=UPI001FEAF2B6|nr:adenosylcobinamide amidohydrolase [Actinomadura meyerae]